MQTIDVDLGPPPVGQESAAEAIAASKALPLQVMAKADTARIGRVAVSGGAVGVSSCVLTFANGCYLFAECQDFSVRWSIGKGLPPVVEAVPPKRLKWGAVDTTDFDPNTVVDEIVGSEFYLLAVTDRSVLVYTKGQEILWLSGLRDKRSGADFLYVYLGE